MIEQQIALKTMHNLQHAAESMLVCYFMADHSDVSAKSQFKNALIAIRSINAILAREGYSLLDDELTEPDPDTIEADTGQFGVGA